MIVLVMALGWAPAQSEGYFTTYNHEVEKGEVELMLMGDFTHPGRTRRREERMRNYFSQMPKLGFNPTDQLELELMLEGFEETGTGRARFTGSRAEVRYRLLHDEVPLNPTIYFEYEDLDPLTRYKMETSGWIRPPYEEEGEEPGRERILESRFILSQNLGRCNFAFNWINETDLQGGVTAFGYTAGIMYRLMDEEEHEGHGEHGERGGCGGGACGGGGGGVSAPAGPGSARPFLQPMSLGLELFGALGDTRAFGLRPSRQEHYLQPSVMFHVGERCMLSLGVALGLTRESDQLVRAMFGVMFRY